MILPAVLTSETWVNAWLEWDDGSFLSIHDRYGCRGEIFARMRIEGSRGALRQERSSQ